MAFIDNAFKRFMNKIHGAKFGYGTERFKQLRVAFFFGFLAGTKVPVSQYFEVQGELKAFLLEQVEEQKGQDDSHKKEPNR